MMKRILFFMLFPLFSFGFSPEEIYRRVTLFYETYPSAFTCEIQGDSLKKSIESIPKDAITDPKNLKIKLLFHKKWGSRVILEGVNEAFRDRFSYIEAVFEFLLPFANKDAFLDFQKKYTIYDIKEPFFKLKKAQTEGSYLEIFFIKNKDLIIISEIKEFKNNKITAHIVLTYQKNNQYFLPGEIKVFFYENEKIKILKFNLTNFDFNPKINEEDFLG